MNRQDYITYLRELYALGRLDMILFDAQGHPVSDFIKVSRHSMLQLRRNRTRRDFVEHLQQELQKGSVSQRLQEPYPEESYYYQAIPVLLAEGIHYLCIGPFYLQEKLGQMVEADVPCYMTPDVFALQGLFQRGAQPPLKERPEGTALPEEEPQVGMKPREEAEMMTFKRMQPSSQIRYNAMREKAIRQAISDGNLSYLLQTSTFDYMMPVHLLSGEGTLVRARRGIASANSVYCRAAEDGGASSVLVRSICADYARRIEEAPSTAELLRLRDEAALTYCRKVREASQNKYSIHVRHCISYLDANLLEDVTLEAAAKACGVSYGYLSKMLKAECGCSFSVLLHRIRCKTAACCLLSGKSITETAGASGYKTNSQFCHAFKKLYHTSPKAWQTEHLNG